MPVPAPLKKPIVPSHRMTESPLRDGKGSKATSQRLSNDAADAHIQVQLLFIAAAEFSLNFKSYQSATSIMSAKQGLHAGVGAHMTRSWGMRPTFSHSAAGLVSCSSRGGGGGGGEGGGGRSGNGPQQGVMPDLAWHAAPRYPSTQSARPPPPPAAPKALPPPQPPLDPRLPQR